MELPDLLEHIADAIVAVDQSGVPFKTFQPGVGPYGEPQLVAAISRHLGALPALADRVAIKRSPDLLIRDLWALEFKIARPFGDNGREAEGWSVNLLHPYPGSVSVIGDCLKLAAHLGAERRAAVVIGYEHSPPRIALRPLIHAFEAIASAVADIPLGPRVALTRARLVHPVHQQVLVVGWEVQRHAG